MEKIEKTNDEWKRELDPDLYHIAREKGTELPFSGKFVTTKDDGTYSCAVCGNELFPSDTKFDAHCGWPSFFAPLSNVTIATTPDTSHGMDRIEVMCAKCGSHLGHVFDDGPQPTGLRYCINSVSLNFKPRR